MKELELFVTTKNVRKVQVCIDWTKQCEVNKVCCELD